MAIEVVAGIDIGGTKIALALSNPEGKIVSITRFPTRIEVGPYQILNEVVTELQRMIDGVSGRLLSIGVGCGGPLDRQQGLILSPPNLHGWDKVPINQILEEKLGTDVILDNDANAAALGEAKYGAGRGLTSLVYMTISTGIGGGIIVDGELVHGVCDGAGEVGHVTVLPDGPQCGCGARGCLESLCSGTSIARRARERLAAGATSSLSQMPLDQVTAKAVAAAALDGDAFAAEIWDETVHYLAIGIGNIFNTLAPQAVIIGGGVSTSGNQLLEPLRLEVRERSKMLPPDKISILKAELGSDSGIYGALMLGQRVAYG